MTSLFTNRQLERFLSLIVIFWSLQLVIVQSEVFLRRLDLPLHTMWQDWLCWRAIWFIVLGLSLLRFFSWFVHWIAFVATGGKPRKSRCWRAQNLVALVLVLYAGFDILQSVNAFLSYLCYVAFNFGGLFHYDFNYVLLAPAQLVVSLIADLVILLYATCLAQWLLRLVTEKLPERP